MRRATQIFLQAIGFTLYFYSAWAQEAQFHGGPAHLGVFDGAAGPNGFFVPVWRFDAGHMVVASPVVSDGVLYAGAKNGKFLALDAKTGARKWDFQADAAITATAAVGDGRIIFETDANTIYALDLNGHELWHRSTGNDLPFDAMAGFHMVEDWDYWASSPLLAEGRVFIGSGDGKLYALDAKTGSVLWTFATQGRVRSSPATDGKAIYAGSFDGRLYALERETGKLIWSFKTLGNKVFPEGSIQSSPTIADGLVLFGARDFNLYALDTKTGRETWHQSVKNSWVPSTPAVDHGRVYTGSADGRAAFAYDLKTGKPLWTTPLDNLVFSSPVIAGDRLYLATMGGSVFAMDAETGRIVGYTLTEDRVLSTPWIADGTIYFGNNDGFIYAMGAGSQNYPGG